MSETVHVNVPVTAHWAGSDVFSSPQYQRHLQEVVQEVVLRYAELMNKPGEPGLELPDHREDVDAP